MMKGFTLIELIVVIAVLVIVAAVGVPRLITTQDDARIALLDGLHASLRSAMALSRGQAIIDGVQNSATADITMDGLTVRMAYGYPAIDTSAPTGEGIVRAAGVNIAAAPNGDFDFNTGTGVFTIQGFSGSNCQVTYTAATSTTSPATTAIVTSGCDGSGGGGSL